jgi:hypothetical protein
MKKAYCAKCGSDNLKRMINPQGGTGNWKCFDCGFESELYIEKIDEKNKNDKRN